MTVIKFEGLYDIHNHLIFGIDDGARNSADAEAMLQDAAKNNVKVIVGTSHISPSTDLDKYKANLPLVQELATQYGIKVLPGAEYNVHTLPEQPPYTVLGNNQSGFVLVDFSLPVFPPEFQLAVDNIFNADNRVIVAHPERTFPESMLCNLGEFAENGVVYQVTAASLLGKYGKSIQRTAWRLLDRSWAKVIASDAHDDCQRPSLLLEAYQAVARRNGMAAAEALQENARLIIEDPAAELHDIPGKKCWFNLGALCR